MQTKSIGNWHKAIWKFVTNPTVEVVAAMALMLLAAWVVVQAEVDMSSLRGPFPVPFGSR